MRFWTLFFITCFALACKGQTKASNPDEDKLICIVPGNDSVLYYEGNNSDFQNTKRGRITDTAYMNQLFHTVRERGFLLVVKSGDGQNMLDDYRRMMDQVSEHGVIHLAIDSLNWKEQRFFGYTTIPVARAAIRGDTTTLRLNLPRDEGQEKDSLSGYPKASQIVIIPTGEAGVYAYEGGDVKTIKPYTYADITEMLKKAKKDAKFSVLIKPAANCSYKNTVDMLDLMATVGIEHYGLVDITRQEEALLPVIPN